MKSEINKIVDEFKKQNSIDFELSFVMPKGYEEAFGTYDVEVDTLFLNINKNNDKILIFYTLFHELRHALQYKKSENFNLDIRQSINYVILYNGNCFKLKDNKWIECHLEGFDFINFYLSLPYEIDANEFAYSEMKKRYGESETLINIYNKNKPTNKENNEELKKIFAQIDEKTSENH